MSKKNTNSVFCRFIFLQEFSSSKYDIYTLLLEYLGDSFSDEAYDILFCFIHGEPQIVQALLRLNNWVSKAPSPPHAEAVFTARRCYARTVLGVVILSVHLSTYRMRAL